jgi:predicted dehydrogenase
VTGALGANGRYGHGSENGHRSANEAGNRVEPHEWERNRPLGAPLRVAVVGLGYWGPNLARNFQEAPAAELAWLCDAREDALQRTARRYPAARATTRLEEVLADPSLDAVAIATPVSSHYALVAASLDAGKHVFVEKPLAASSDQAGELIARAEKNGLVLMPGHTFLYSPPVNLVRSLIADGELGEIYFISTSRVNLGLHQPDVSVAWDLGPHDFSILRYWLDETPSHLAALSRSCIMPRTPDVAFINLEFASGTVAHVEICWLAPTKLRRTTVVGSRKMVVYDDTSNEPVRVFDSGVFVPDPASFGEYQLTYRTGDIVSPHVDVAEPLLLEVEDFCAAIRSGSKPRSSKELGLDVVRIIEAVDASLDLNGARVAVDAGERTVA